MSNEDAQKIADAAIYALKCGCFFPVPEPQKPYRTQDLIQWGAMRNLHNQIAKLPKRDA